MPDHPVSVRLRKFVTMVLQWIHRQFNDMFQPFHKLVAIIILEYLNELFKIYYSVTILLNASQVGYFVKIWTSFGYRQCIFGQNILNMPINVLKIRPCTCQGYIYNFQIKLRIISNDLKCYSFLGILR